MPKVLIVEDDPDLSKALEASFFDAGYDVDTVANGLDALRRLGSTRPDVMLLDLSLPEMDGTDVCLRVKDDPETADIKIVMVTARGAPPDRFLGKELGADGYVVKPLDFGKLVKKVDKTLKR